MTEIMNKSPKVQKRINAIKTDIEHYLNSIKRLKAFLKYQQEIDRAPYAPRIIKYNRIPRSEKIFQWTLQNITTQMKFLEVELETLIKYGQEV
ncbi:MAG: hypothetical protein K0R24_2353 [Gammaproteobacteria bacterium]|jgi:hypothetical protein|nr:hypothetical protein [Gammaproteobacteria bacterium]